MNAAVTDRDRLGRSAVWVLLLLQAGLVAWTFPLSAVLDPTPLLTIDGGYHWYQITVAKELADAGRLTGFDTMFAGGHLAGVGLNASAKVPALMSVLARDYLSVAQIYKLYVFFAALLGPVCIAWACRIQRMPRGVSALAMALGMLMWWVGAFRWYHTAGMVSFVLACYASIPFAALVVRAIGAEGTVRDVATTGALGALGFLLHPLFPLFAAFPMLLLLLAKVDDIKLSRLLGVSATVSLISLLPNLTWLLAVLNGGMEWMGTHPYQRLIDLWMVPRELLAQWQGSAMGSKLYAGLLVATAAGLLVKCSPGMRRFAVVSLVVWLGMSLLAWGGAAIPGVGELQPNRLAPAAYLLLVLPAANNVLCMIRDFAAQEFLRKMLIASSLTVVGSSFMYSTWELSREVSYSPVGHYGAIPPEVRGAGQLTDWVISMLQSQTTTDGRVLFETSLARIHDGGHMAGYIAMSSGREFIGGPYPHTFYAGYWDGHVFGRPLQEIAEADLRRNIDAFNVGWIVAHSRTSKEHFSRIPWISQLASNGPVSIYKVDRELGYFFEGNGQVESRGINRLALSELGEGSVAIKYRYIPGLIVRPSGQVQPYTVPGIKEPFIAISGISGGRAELSLQ